MSKSCHPERDAFCPAKSLSRACRGNLCEPRDSPAFFAGELLARLACFLISGGKLLESQEFNQLPVEFLRTFFIRQVSNPRKNDHPGIWKVFRQPLSRGSIHCRIFAAPHEKCRNAP